METLRLRLTSAQSRIGQAPDASEGGNSSKRIRLRLRVTGFSPEGADRLAHELSRPDGEIPLHRSPGGSQAGQVVPENSVTRVEENRFTGDGGAVDGATARSAEAEQIEEAVAQAAGKTTRLGRGQGFQLDQAVKVAVEDCAMKAASDFYGEGWDVEDVHGNQSYDLICRRDGEVKHVEVKGTTTVGTEVILTPNEVRHAREYPCTALFILSNITVERAEDGTVTATGGGKHVYDPWPIDEGTLIPLGFRYLVPDETSS